MKHNIIQFYNNLPLEEKQILLVCTLLPLFTGYAIWFEQGANLVWAWTPVVLWLIIIAGRLYWITKCRKTNKIQ